MKLLNPDSESLHKPLPTFDDSQLKDDGYKTRQELVDDMFKFMAKAGGIGLTANQVGINLNMFVLGGHPSIEDGLKLACFNPVIVSMSQEKVKMKEGCLSYPFIFLNIERSRKCVGKYEDADGELKEAHLDGYMSRIFQHEYEHTQGKSMIDGVSKFRFDLAKKKAEKLATKHARELQRIKREKDDKSDI